MAAVLGYLIATGAAIAIAWLGAGRGHTVTRDASINLGDAGGRHVSIVAGLSGFAVTGMVLIVTLGRNLPDASGTSFTTLLTMFFVAYMGYFATSLMFANVSDPGPKPGFDVPAAAYAGAAVTLYFTVIIGWLALRPLFQTFGLTRMAQLAGWLLVVAVIGGYGLVAQHLHRSGYGSPRLIVLMPLLSAVAALLFAVIVARFGLGSSEATLDLTITAFVIGASAFGLLTAMPVLGQNKVIASGLARYGPLLIVGYAQGVIMVVAFLLLSILGFA